MTDRWATFDCYGTLIDWEGGIVAALQSLWPGKSRDEMLAVYHRHEPVIQRDGAPPYREVLARAQAAVAGELGLAVPPGRERTLPESLASWPAFPDTAAGLAAVKARGWRLAILSNVDPDLIASSLPKLGVAFDLVITRAEAGSYKPAPGHWDEFFARSGADRSRHVHVAASLFHDIEPAAAMGMPAIWINRKGETSDLPRRAELTTLAGLADALDREVPA